MAHNASCRTEQQICDDMFHVAFIKPSIWQSDLQRKMGLQTPVKTIIQQMHEQYNREMTAAEASHNAQEKAANTAADAVALETAYQTQDQTQDQTQVQTQHEDHANDTQVVLDVNPSDFEWLDFEESAENASWHGAEDAWQAFTIDQ
jgi:hypothetical protein